MTRCESVCDHSWLTVQNLALADQTQLQTSMLMLLFYHQWYWQGDTKFWCNLSKFWTNGMYFFESKWWSCFFCIFGNSMFAVFSITKSIDSVAVVVFILLNMKISSWLRILGQFEQGLNEWWPNTSHYYCYLNITLSFIADVSYGFVSRRRLGQAWCVKCCAVFYCAVYVVMCCAVL